MIGQYIARSNSFFLPFLLGSFDVRRRCHRARDQNLNYRFSQASRIFLMQDSVLLPPNECWAFLKIRKSRFKWVLSLRKCSFLIDRISLYKFCLVAGSMRNIDFCSSAWSSLLKLKLARYHRSYWSSFATPMSKRHSHTNAPQYGNWHFGYTEATWRHFPLCAFLWLFLINQKLNFATSLRHAQNPNCTSN